MRDFSKDVEFMFYSIEVLLVERFFQQAGDSRRAVFVRLQTPFGVAQLIGQMQRGEHRRAHSITGIAAAGDGPHQIIDLLRQFHRLTGVTLRQQRIGLIENVDANRLLCHPLLN